MISLPIIFTEGYSKVYTLPQEGAFEMIEKAETFFLGIHWAYQVIAFGIFLIVLNVCLSTLLHTLYHRFKKRGSVWRASFFEALNKPLSIYIWFFFVVYTIYLIDSHLNLSSLVEELILDALTIGGILAAGWFAFRWKRITFKAMSTQKYWEKGGLDQGHIDALDKLLTVVIAFIFLVWLLEALGQGIGALLTIGGVGAAAIAFASKEFIANFFGGFMIYLNRPFKSGDVIKLISKDTLGIVEEIGWYMTRIRDFEKQSIYIPNSMFSQFIVINLTERTHRLIKETIGVRYSDFSSVKSIIDELRTYILEHPNLDHDLRQGVNFTAYGDSSLDIAIFTYTSITSMSEFNMLKEEVLFKAAEVVHKHGADFAYPTITLDPGENTYSVAVSKMPSS